MFPAQISPYQKLNLAMQEAETCVYILMQNILLLITVKRKYQGVLSSISNKRLHFKTFNYPEFLQVQSHKEL